MARWPSCPTWLDEGDPVMAVPQVSTGTAGEKGAQNLPSAPSTGQ